MVAVRRHAPVLPPASASYHCFTFGLHAIPAAGRAAAARAGRDLQERLRAPWRRAARRRSRSYPQSGSPKCLLLKCCLGTPSGLRPCETERMLMACKLLSRDAELWEERRSTAAGWCGGQLCEERRAGSEAYCLPEAGLVMAGVGQSALSKQDANEGARRALGATGLLRCTSPSNAPALREGFTSSFFNRQLPFHLGSASPGLPAAP